MTLGYPPPTSFSHLLPLVFMVVQCKKHAAPFLMRHCWFPVLGCLNIKMSSYRHRDSHHKDRIVSSPFYPYNGNPYTCKNGLCTETGLRFFQMLQQVLMVHCEICYSTANVSFMEYYYLMYAETSIFLYSHCPPSPHQAGPPATTVPCCACCATGPAATWLQQSLDASLWYSLPGLSLDYHSTSVSEAIQYQGIIATIRGTCPVSTCVASLQLASAAAVSLHWPGWSSRAWSLGLPFTVASAIYTVGWLLWHCLLHSDSYGQQPAWPALPAGNIWVLDIRGKRRKNCTTSKGKGCHIDEFVITDCTRSCQNDNLWCSQ